MVAVINFIFFVIGALLQLLTYAIIASAILSWLVLFDVINLRNRYVYGVTRFLDAVTRPVLAPFQRIIPTLGGVDISPVVALIVLWGVADILLPTLQNFLISLVS